MALDLALLKIPSCLYYEWCRNSKDYLLRWLLWLLLAFCFHGFTHTHKKIVYQVINSCFSPILARFCVPDRRLDDLSDVLVFLVEIWCQTNVWQLDSTEPNLYILTCPRHSALLLRQRVWYDFLVVTNPLTMFFFSITIVI